MAPCKAPAPRARLICIKNSVYIYDTTLRSQNAEQLRENGWLCRNCKHLVPPPKAPRFPSPKVPEPFGSRAPRFPHTSTQDRD